MKQQLQSAWASHGSVPMSKACAPTIAAGKDTTTQQLTRVWQELLGVESVGVHQNYFDLGGDSSLAVQLFARIEKLFRVKLPLATLFEAPTIEELARVVQQEAGAGADPGKRHATGILLHSRRGRQRADLSRTGEVYGFRAAFLWRAGAGAGW